MKEYKKRALFSLFDQEKSVIYAKQLCTLGWEIVATRETFNLFKKRHIPVMDISKFLKINNAYPFPPTLHPTLELALTTHCKTRIDLVYITTYPLSKGDDVGGHTVLALAAKGNRIVVFEREVMGKVLKDLRHDNISNSLRSQLIDEAHKKITKHYASLAIGAKTSQTTEIIVGKKGKPLLEGENPYQVTCDLIETEKEDNLALSRFEQSGGPLPCYTNMSDFNSVLKTLCLLAESFIKYYHRMPFITIVAKHGNPCGLSIDWKSPQKTIIKAFSGHPIAVFGGEVITNFSISKKLAELLTINEDSKCLIGRKKWNLDLVIAPDFTKDGIKVLKKRKKMKLFRNKNLKHPSLAKLDWSYRMVRGGMLKQTPNDYILDISLNDSGKGLRKSETFDSLLIAWAVAWSSMHGGNEVALAKDRKLLGVGGGPTTVDACSTAIDRAKNSCHNLKDCVFAADAFFPFTDAPEKLINTGCLCGVVPKGGKNYKSIKDIFARNNINVFYLAEKYRGFCRH